MWTTKSESFQRHHLKRNETMGKKADHNRAHTCLLESISATPLTAVQLPLTPASSNLPIFVLLLHETCEVPPSPFPSSFAPQPPALPPSPSPQRRLQNLLFPNPASVLFSLSYTPTLLQTPTMAHPRSAFLRQTVTSLC